MSGGYVVYHLTQITLVLPATFTEISYPREQQCTKPENVLLGFRNTRFQPSIWIRHVTNRRPADRDNWRLKVAHRGREEKGTVITLRFVLVTESSRRTREGRRTGNISDRSTTPSNQRLQSRAHRRAQGIRVRYGGIGVRCFTSTGVSWIANALECASDTDTPKPTRRPYVLQSVTVQFALRRNHPFNHHTYIVTLPYYVPGWFSLFATYFRLLKAPVEIDILQKYTLRNADMLSYPDPQKKICVFTGSSESFWSAVVT